MAGENITLHELSQEQLPVAIPSIIYLSILVVIGLIGNVFVVIVFGFKLKKMSTYRHFILVLAGYDLLACCAGMPGLIVEIGSPYLFTSHIGCKILRYGYHTISAGASVTHALVGIDRYRRICKATDRQISIHTARSLSYCMLTASLIIALPTIFIHDIVPVETRVPNISGHRCDVAKYYDNTLFPLLYESTLTVLVLIIILTMVILYTLIGRRLYQRMKFVKSKTSNTHSICSPERGVLNGVNVNTINIKHHFENKIEPWQPRTTEVSEMESELQSVVHDHESLTVANSGLSAIHTTERSKPTQVRAVKNRETVSRKVTITSFAVIAVYIGSFMPLQVLQVVYVSNRNIIDNVTDTQLIFYQLGFLTYAIDNVANPIIYVFLDKDFREACKGLIRSLKCK